MSDSDKGVMPMSSTERAVPPSSTDLAVDRTRLAHERTLMAWVRTATSLISFGFTIYKFFQTMQEKGEGQPHRLFGPREFALIMIGIGLIALALATIMHLRDIRALRTHFASVPYSLATAIAALVAVLGLLAFVAVIFRQ
jgi:putative membrane protein